MHPFFENNNNNLYTMKIKHLRFKNFILVAIFALMSGSAWAAYDFIVDDIYYHITDATNFTVEVTSNNGAYNSYSGAIVIPATVINPNDNQVYSVTAIGAAAFRECTGLTSVNGDSQSNVNIPANITSIGSQAFLACSGLTGSLTIPATVTSMGNYAFQHCTGLSSVSIDMDIPDGAFTNCTNLATLQLGNNVTSIGGSAFSQTALSGILSIPDGVTSIGAQAFQDLTDLTTLSIGTGLASIGNYAFDGCTGLTSISFGTHAFTIGSNAFQDCTGLTDLTLPANLTSVGQSAFRGCSGLENIYFYAANCSFSQFYVWSGCTHACTVTIGNGVAGLPNNAFRELTGLNAIVWGEHTALTIGDYAFFGCMGLTTLTVPEFVTSIGYGTFAHLDNLTRVNYNATNCAVNEYAWYASNVSIDRNTHLEIGNNVTHLSGRPFAHFTDLTTVTIGESVTNIGSMAFYESDHIETVNYNATNCTSVPNDIWTNCRNLRTVNIGDNVTHLRRVFYNTDITSVNFGEHPSLEVIGANAFWACDKLTSFTIPNTVTTIGEQAFMYDKFTTLTIGSDVTSIGESAFSYCSGLETIYWNVTNADNNLTIGGYCWSGTDTHPHTLVIGDNVANLPNNAFDGFSGLTSLTIGSGLSTISEGAFKNCSGLTSVTIPGNITTIAKNAFSGCTGLTSITIPASVTSIGDYAFQYCNGLTSVNFNANCTSYGSSVWFRNSNDSPASCALTIGDNVTALPNSAFYHFAGLTSFTLGSRVTAISDGAFCDCDNLTGVVIPDAITSIGRDAFSGCNGLTSLTIGTGVDFIGTMAFYNCNHLETVNYNATNCTSVGEPAGGHWHLDGAGNGTNCTLTIGNNVTSIPENIFHSFTGLTSLVFESGSVLTTISEYAFDVCYHLTSVSIANSVKTIDKSAFNGCTALSSLDLGSVETINQNAFYGCTSLTTLTIPASVTLIDAHTEWHTHGAFRNCTNLEEIWFEGPTPPNFVDPAFDGVSHDIPVYVPRECGYPTEGAWAYFTNYIPYSRFVGGSGETGTKWDVSGNWAYGTPESTDAALVEAIVVIPEGYNAEAQHVVFKTGKYIIIEDGGQLSCNSIAAPDNTYVNIRDGGQLVCSTEAKATLERSITGYGESDKDGWYFIASPAKTAIGPSMDNGLLSNEYDLYRYFEYDYTWHNYKKTTFPLSNSWGYLYANNTNNTLNFGGTMLAANAEVTVEDLSYASPYAPLKGFNLMGNPFTHNLTADDITLGGTPVTTYYMVENGSEIVPVQLSETPIKPGRGFIVQATEAGQDLVFNPSAKGNTSKVGYINIAAGNDAFTDKAFIQMGGGNTLRKMTLAENTPKVYVQQGNYNYAVANVTASENMIPVAFEVVENGTYTITVDVKGIETNYLHLIDNLTGADIDLLITPSYSFEAKTTDYASRFRLVFNANGASTGSEAETFAYYDGSEWVIANIDEAILQVVDMLGRVVSSETVTGNAVVSINQPAGVYVMRLLNGENVRVQKVVVR